LIRLAPCISSAEWVLVNRVESIATIHRVGWCVISDGCIVAPMVVDLFGKAHEDVLRNCDLGVPVRSELRAAVQSDSQT
jgi:hypothetical protein